MENEELLKKIADNSAKSLKFHTISAICMAGILVVFILMYITVVPVVNKADTVLDSVNEVATSAAETVNNAQSTLDEIDKMAKSLQETSEGMNKLIDENGKSLTDSLTKMSQIDFDGLNSAIKDLQDAVGPFATFMNRFR